ncbi:PNC family class C beta-lactamase [Pandoraea apista]|uniref:PNC family class C beta-lactamase n=1 Tax=Pandoraea apista TaxID=93218 RepID=UPI0006588651|nr:class C beta-lactamase [Pandoraea apista]AVF38933.1 class C beta-lactamase [Pandoraea apista]RRW96577.1 class C beta-lactamase [Pandoraea apista]RRX02090.1 class C beta-lactamase [Pandoraea apista]CFB61906.1 Beta-lactamase [Pandoraea apista]
MTKPYLTLCATLAAATAIGWMAFNARSYAAGPDADATADPRQAEIKLLVDNTITPLMARQNVPGMAVGIVFDGHTYVFDYGVADKAAKRPVTPDTLFEIGSVSKTFTATLAAYAQATGALSLNDKTRRFVPELAGTPFGDVTLVNLGTHTTGGMPLQAPDDIRDTDQMLQYLKTWKPAQPTGTVRTYSNVSIGALGWITARAMHGDFSTLVTEHVFKPLDLTHTFIRVPKDQQANYAWGYGKDGKPIRVSPGVFEQEAYGVKTTASDLLRFVQANLGTPARDNALQQAILATHTGYFFDKPMTQDLIWEQYPYPVSVDALLEGNSNHMAYEPTPAHELSPPMAPASVVWINKTGSTNGFGAYVAFVPSKQMGIVLLANKNYPMDERIRAAHHILTTLDGGTRATGASRE